MDWSSKPRLKLMLQNVFLLVSTSIVCLHGNPIAGEHSLHCVNDYLSTINCTLSFAPTENTSDSESSYWLTLTRKTEQNTFVCKLTNTNEGYFCSVETSDPMDDEDDYDYLETFADIETFKISLCHNQNDGPETCKVLDGKYAPMANIKPNAPSCLTVNHNSSQHHFTWKSTYEKCGPFTALVKNFKYQLRYFKRGDKHNGDNGVMSHDINTDRTSYSVDDQVFVSATEYAARVRSSPNLAFYKGQWSDWSPEVHWRTESDVPKKTFISEMGKKVFISLSVMVPLVLLFCYAPVKKWRQSAFIPTPAPYFHTLYSDCQGDFKSWVITHENTADMLKVEASLQIDTLTKCEDVPEEDCQTQVDHLLTEGSAYSNIIGPVCDTSLLGVPYAVSTMAALSATGDSLKSLTLSSQPGSPAEGDSGCWLCSDTSLDKDSPWYCNEYCTLSAFQQTSPVTVVAIGEA
ncbi:interleukin-21 receptor [Seriola aureovittata]|uniref:interleukin-21 receptor n=1 Tax=Seriola aureovittata TaxID=2871759 RepID=UPI0024BE771F|nr:interleukin-21 receptor [Seriola aureovittata]